MHYCIFATVMCKNDLEFECASACVCVSGKERGGKMKERGKGGGILLVFKNFAAGKLAPPFRRLYKDNT